MSSGTPWWYSGDESEPPPVEATPDEATEDQATADEATADDGSRDWTSLVLGAQRLVDWATERVMAPHSEHQDPREHPDCVVCRTMTMLGDVGLRTPSPADEPVATPEPHDPSDPGTSRGLVRRTAIEWIPIRGESTSP